MVSELQACFASKTDAVGSEGIEELWAMVVPSMAGCTAKIVLRLASGLAVGNAQWLWLGS